MRQIALNLTLVLALPIALLTVPVSDGPAIDPAGTQHPPVPAATASGQAAPSDANGAVLMVHGHVDPWPLGHEVPPLHEAVVTTPHDGTVTLYVIPYAGAPLAPTLVEDPVLTITSQAGDGTFTAQPTGEASEHHTCEAETQFEGHEGPVEACLVFQIPTDALPEGSAVTMRLGFLHQADTYSEPYNAVGHAMLHEHMNGSPITRSDVDSATAEPTPYLVAAELPAPAS